MGWSLVGWNWIICSMGPPLVGWIAFTEEIFLWLKQNYGLYWFMVDITWYNYSSWGLYFHQPNQLITGGHHPVIINKNTLISFSLTRVFATWSGLIFAVCTSALRRCFTQAVLAVSAASHFAPLRQRSGHFRRAPKLCLSRGRPEFERRWEAKEYLRYRHIYTSRLSLIQIIYKWYTHYIQIIYTLYTNCDIKLMSTKQQLPINGFEIMGWSKHRVHRNFTRTPCFPTHKGFFSLQTSPATHSGNITYNTHIYIYIYMAVCQNLVPL